MSFAGALMADGQVSDSKGTLYTVPASTVAYIGFFSLFNTNAATQTIIVYINNGTSRKVRQFDLDQNESADVLESSQKIVLEAGDLIEAETTTASAVDFVISGVEEDIS